MNLKVCLSLLVVVLTIENSLACATRRDLNRLMVPLRRRLLTNCDADIVTLVRDSIREALPEISSDYESKILEATADFQRQVPTYLLKNPQYYQQLVMSLPFQPVQSPCCHQRPPPMNPPCCCEKTTPTRPPCTTTTTSTTTPCPTTCAPVQQCNCGSPTRGCGCQQDSMYDKILMLFSGKQPQYPVPCQYPAPCPQYPAPSPQYPQYPAPCQSCQCAPNQCNCQNRNGCDPAY